MSYRQTAAATARTGARNVVGVAAASLLLSLTVLPLVVAVPFGTVAVVGGLWATCLLFGAALVGTFRFTVEAADRGVSVSFRPHFVAAVVEPTLGLKLGASTFAVLVCAAAGVGLAPATYRGIVGGVAAFTLVCWYVVVAFASPELAAGTSLRSALGTGATRAAATPIAAVLFVLLSAACAALAGVTVITVFLLLPGALALLGSAAALAVGADSRERDGERPDADGETRER